MDLNGAAALVVALSGLCATCSGIVIAFRVAALQRVTGLEGAKAQVNVNMLPPESPKPGDSVAIGNH